jgi:hypothetical protein
MKPILIRSSLGRKKTVIDVSENQSWKELIPRIANLLYIDASEIEDMTAQAMMREDMSLVVLTEESMLHNDRFAIISLTPEKVKNRASYSEMKSYISTHKDENMEIIERHEDRLGKSYTSFRTNEMAELYNEIRGITISPASPKSSATPESPVSAMMEAIQAQMAANNAALLNSLSSLLTTEAEQPTEDKPSISQAEIDDLRVQLETVREELKAQIDEQFQKVDERLKSIEFHIGRVTEDNRQEYAEFLDKNYQ